MQLVNWYARLKHRTNVKRWHEWIRIDKTTARTLRFATFPTSFQCTAKEIPISLRRNSKLSHRVNNLEQDRISPPKPSRKSNPYGTEGTIKHRKSPLARKVTQQTCSAMWCLEQRLRNPGWHWAVHKKGRLLLGQPLSTLTSFATTFCRSTPFISCFMRVVTYDFQSKRLEGNLKGSECSRMELLRHETSVLYQMVEFGRQRIFYNRRISRCSWHGRLNTFRVNELNIHFRGKTIEQRKSKGNLRWDAHKVKQIHGG